MFTKLAPFLTIFVETDSGQTDGPASKLLRGDAWQAKLTIERVQGDCQVLTLTVTPQGTLRLKRLGLLFSSKLLPTGTRLIGFGGLQDINADAPLAAKPQIGGFAIGLLLPMGDNWLLGIDTFYDLPSIFSLVNGQLSAGWLGQTVISQTTSWSWRLSRGKNLERLFDDYADSLTKSYPPTRRPRLDVLTGWNSWDYYGGAISMQTVEKELKAISQSPLRGKLTYFTLDMGWEEFWGDWRPNRRFPARLATIANRIKAHGLTPGLWLAPFQVGLFTELARFRPELFLHYRDTGTPIITSAGSPLGGMLLLDFAKSETQKLVTGWFRQFY
ncbi:MAG TPA: alpha-galactosidase, partial [Lentisphaeria bacterium]|nr:alpha-galactosidase [Lentisphaeria bacterium]